MAASPGPGRGATRSSTWSPATTARWTLRTRSSCRCPPVARSLTADSRPATSLAGPNSEIPVLPTSTPFLLTVILRTQEAFLRSSALRPTGGLCRPSHSRRARTPSIFGSQRVEATQVTTLWLLLVGRPSTRRLVRAALVLHTSSLRPPRPVPTPCWHSTSPTLPLGGIWMTYVSFPV